MKDTIGKYLEEHPERLETIKILDPACGSGAFLNQAHSFLLEQYKIITEDRINSADLKRNQLNLFKHQNKAETNREILLNSIFGVDLNNEGVEITKLALWLQTAYPNYKLQNLDKNIRCGNSLIENSNIDSRAFVWKDEFQEIINEGGFDIIVGNPPYGAEMDELSKTYYQKNYTDVIVRYLNTYNFFIKRSIDLLKEGGYLSFIVPNTLLYQLEDKNTRKFLLDNCEIKTVINLGDGIFEDAEVPTCIFIVKKNTKVQNDSYLYADLRNFKDTIGILNFNAHCTNYDLEAVKNDEFNAFGIDGNFAKLQCKLSENQCIGDISDVQQGIITGRNPVYIFKNNEDIINNNIEMSLMKPLLRGENINKYNITSDDSKILYVNKSTNIDMYPNALNYLEQFKEILSTKRETKKGILPFWSLWWARTDDLFLNDKILLRQTGDKLVAALDVNNYYVLDIVLVRFFLL